LGLKKHFPFTRFIHTCQEIKERMIFKPSGLLGTWEFSVKGLLDKFRKKGDDNDASIRS